MMNLLQTVTAISVVLIASVCGDTNTRPAPNVNRVAGGLEKQVEKLMANKQAPEAIKLLKQELVKNPNSIVANRELGEIYAFVSSEPAQAVPFLECSWGQGDKKSLRGLGYALMASQDIKKILQHQNAFVQNFDHLGGTRAIVFYIAGLKKDKKIFDEALKKVSLEDISKYKTLAMMIAKSAKLVSD